MPLPLPISPADALSRVIRPAFELLPSKMGGERAELLVLAIMLQESDLAARVQGGGGPARGLAQFEEGNRTSRGGVWGVLNHDATAALARKLCAARGCPPTVRSAYLALAGDDVLAAGFARLLLWTNPAPLPAVGDEDGAWRYYVGTWHPGKPRPITWPGNYELAAITVAGTGEPT